MWLEGQRQIEARAGIATNRRGSARSRRVSTRRGAADLAGEHFRRHAIAELDGGNFLGRDVAIIAGAILSFAGRLSQSWKPRISPSRCSGISE